MMIMIQILVGGIFLTKPESFNNINCSDGRGMLEIGHFLGPACNGSWTASILIHTFELVHMLSISGVGGFKVEAATIFIFRFSHLNVSM